jgi:hypothetical protein
MSLGTERAIEIAQQAEEHYRNGNGFFVPSSTVGDLVNQEPPRADNAMDTGLQVVPYTYLDEEQAFPKVDVGLKPLGNMLLLQLRQPPIRAGNIWLDPETRKTERDNCQVAKVLAMGPLCYRDRKDFSEWPEGAWCKVGDYVRITKYQGDRLAIPCVVLDSYTTIADGKLVVDEVSDIVECVMMKDLSILAIEEQPLARRSYL